MCWIDGVFGIDEVDGFVVCFGNQYKVLFVFVVVEIFVLLDCVFCWYFVGQIVGWKDVVIGGLLVQCMQVSDVICVVWCCGVQCGLCVWYWQ